MGVRELYRDLAPSVTGYLRLHGAPEPDDLASETFIGVFTGLGGFRVTRTRCGPGSSPSRTAGSSTTGVVAAAVPRCPTTPATSSNSWAATSRTTAAPRRDGEVHRLCASLPDDQRTVILLRILADLTVEQVGEAMGRSVPSVKALQRRGLRALRDTRWRPPPNKFGATAYPFDSLRR